MRPLWNKFCCQKQWVLNVEWVSFFASCYHHWLWAREGGFRIWQSLIFLKYFFLSEIYTLSPAFKQSILYYIFIMNAGKQSIDLELQRKSSSWFCYFVLLPFLQILGINFTSLWLSFLKRKIGEFFWKIVWVLLIKSTWFYLCFILKGHIN